MPPLLLALALCQASPPGAASAAGEPTAAAPGATAPAARDVTVTRTAGGGFTATLDGAPVAGAAFYRAVLRFDLAARYDAARDRRRALAVAAVAAPLAGLTAGLVYAGVTNRPPPSCTAVVPPPANCQAMVQENEQWNQQQLRRGLTVGGLGGLAAGLALGWAAWRVDLPAPTAAEAEALARAYRERNGLPPAPSPAAPTGSLRLSPRPGGALLSLAGRF